MAHMAAAKLTPGRQIGHGPAAAIQAVASKKAAPTNPAAPTQPAAIQGAAKRYSGAYSGALNNLSDQENRAHAVAARRQADADKYSAYVLGQQGSIAAAAHRQDQSTLGADTAIQAATLGSQLKLQQGLADGRAAQGVAGPVPLQQRVGLVDDQQVGQALMGVVTQQQADKTNTNAGKAQFLQAAAQAALMANKRAIAGDEFNQVTDINSAKTGVLTQRTESAQADKRAAASAQASNAAAQLAHEDRMASLTQQGNIAADNRANSNAQLDARLTSAATQGRANRRVRLKTAATGAAALGYVTPAEQKRRTTQVKATNDLRDKVIAQVQGWAPDPKHPDPDWTPETARILLDKNFKGAPPEVIDYALAHAFGRKAGVTKGKQPSAAARYTKYVNDINAGKISK